MKYQNTVSFYSVVHFGKISWFIIFIACFLLCGCEKLKAEQANPDFAIYRVNIERPKNSKSVDFSRLLPAEVIHHIDGDTVRVRIQNPPEGLNPEETVRFIGVNTPETVHPRKEVEEFGQEASDFTKAELFGKTIYLAFDWDLRDRYGRLLAYVYTEDFRCFNAELIRLGYGHAYTHFPFHFLKEFRGYEKEARLHKRGLWGLRVRNEE